MRKSISQTNKTKINIRGKEKFVNYIGHIPHIQLRIFIKLIYLSLLQAGNMLFSH